MEIVNKMNISNSSKVQYSYLLKRMEKLDFKPPMEEDQEISKVNEYLSQFENPKVRLSMLNIIIVLRRESGLKVDDLRNLRDGLDRDFVKSQFVKLKEKKEVLPTYESILVKLQEVYEHHDILKFVVNWLFVYFGVRNLDVDVYVVRRKKDTSDLTKNYLWWSKKRIVYIRNNDKTMSTYGQKVLEITDPRMITMLKPIEGRLLPEGKLSNIIRKLYLFPNLNESNIFKIVINHYYMNDNHQIIKTLAHSRGTNLSTIDLYYNVNKTPNPILDK